MYSKYNKLCFPFTGNKTTPNNSCQKKKHILIKLATMFNPYVLCPNKKENNFLSIYKIVNNLYKIVCDDSFHHYIRFKILQSLFLIIRLL